MASAKRLASSAISLSSMSGAVCADALRLEPGGLFSEVSPVGAPSSGDDDDDDDDDDDGSEDREGKKHLKILSACHLVALVKLTQMSIRPGLLSAGSRRSM